MEALTSGMKNASLTTKTQGQGNAQQAKPETKKITKLSLTTKAQREAREKAQLAAKATRAAEPTPESTAEVAIPGGSGSSLNGNSVDTIPRSDAHLSRSDHPSSVEPQLSPYNTPAVPPVPTLPQTVPADVHGATEIPLPPSSPPEMRFDSATISPTTSGADIFIPYQPEGPAASTTVQPDSFKWLPPNTSTPANMKKGGLPVFTSTSAIPFGATSGIDQGVPKSANEWKPIKQEKKPGDDSIWDVPETPRK
jgi:histone deacetylase HOS3